MNDTVGKFYSFRGRHFNAAERQSDKAWGFNPRLGGIRGCALKGRREADL
ncbi:MAG: hypothetical protein GY795_45070, partial [Desulfobacterales bacterium]|nr:hypothetical protein [Desulfobacterales bacterium]